jgi:hypothetical protein
LHHYDGQIRNTDPSAATAAREGYSRLMELIAYLKQGGIEVKEVITSGTPATPHALSFAPFGEGEFVHRVSPGTIVYNDRNSLKELPDYWRLSGDPARWNDADADEEARRETGLATTAGLVCPIDGGPRR